MMNVLVFGKRFIDIGRALAEQNIMIADIEAGHPGVAETPEVLESEQVPIKFFRFVQIIHRDGPMCHSFYFEQSHNASFG
jgi:hypothetical protein